MGSECSMFNVQWDGWTWTDINYERWSPRVRELDWDKVVLSLTIMNQSALRVCVLEVEGYPLKGVNAGLRPSARPRNPPKNTCQGRTRVVQVVQ